MTTTSPNGVKQTVTKSPVILEKIYKADFQKEGTLTAQLRQVITTVSSYPSKKTANELQSGLFSTEEFGFESQDFESTETRVAWIPVPENATQEQIAAKLAAANQAGACIYRVLSNAPILSADQKFAISNNMKTIDDFADTQVVRYPENEETIANGTAGKLTLDKSGRVQYRRTYFWNTPQADIDTRDGVNVYESAKIKAELAGASVMQGQTL